MMAGTFSPSRSTVACVFLAALALSSCGQPKSGSGGTSPAADPAAPAPAEEQLVFSAPQFTAPIFMHIPADNFASSQVLAAENGRTVEWWTFIRSNVGCVQQGYATTIGFVPTPSVDGYNFDGRLLEQMLETARVRAIQTYNLTLNPTPWGSIARSFACTINTGDMAPFAQGQDLHGALAISLAQRVCARWTYVNHYQNATPGQGTVQVFAGTFTYTMKPLVDGAQFGGEGTASVKLYLNPDNGRWTIAEYQLQDPHLTFSGFSGVEQAAPPQTSCPVQGKTPA